MFQLVFFTLFTSGFTELQEKVICNNTDMELSYSYCDSVVHLFSFSIVPCSLVEEPWRATVFWIPRSDIIYMKWILRAWYNGSKLLDVKKVVCSGFDDDFSFCGSLKGETINTTIRFSGLNARFKKGIYIITVQGVSDHSEENLMICLNATLTVKK